jgi:O-acetyl-ADP-ribose deacetylase (regulator of RNase III)
MAKINYLKGDATRPTGDGWKIISHICNDIGGWGAGFVLAISKKWKEPELLYRQWFSNKFFIEDGVRIPFELGMIQKTMVSAEDKIYVCNMIAQHGIRVIGNKHPLRYEAVEQCLSSLATNALLMEATVHMPRIGCGLAGGKWEEIEPIIQRTLIAKNIDVFVYDI